MGLLLVLKVQLLMQGVLMMMMQGVLFAGRLQHLRGPTPTRAAWLTLWGLAAHPILPSCESCCAAWQAGRQTGRQQGSMPSNRQAGMVLHRMLPAFDQEGRRAQVQAQLHIRSNSEAGTLYQPAPSRLVHCRSACAQARHAHKPGIRMPGMTNAMA